MKLRQPIQLLALLVAWLTAVDSSAQTATSTNSNPPAPERFLIIVETSAAMQKRADNVRMVVGSVIANGLKGQMPSGGTVGLWTFNEQLFAGLMPLQLWTPATRQRVAQKVVQVLEQQKNEKSSRLAAIWPAITNLVANSEHLTLLLVTSGSDPISSTPYDALITESFSKNAEQQRKSNMPFLTILRAAKGQIVAFAVNTPPWPLEVPEYPEEFKPTPPPPPAPVVTNAPPPVAKRPDRSVLSPTNVIHLVETSAPVEVPSLPPAPALEPTNQPVIAPPQTTNAPPTNPPPAATIKNKPTPPAATPVAAPTPLQSEPLEKQKSSMATILVVGICLLVGVLALFVLLLRRSRGSTRESLITRSMNQNNR
jgi:hypothetical protein